MLKVTLQWTSIPFRGRGEEKKYPWSLHATETGLMGHMQTKSSLVVMPKIRMLARFRWLNHLEYAEMPGLFDFQEYSALCRCRHHHLQAEDWGSLARLGKVPLVDQQRWSHQACSMWSLVREFHQQHSKMFLVLLPKQFCWLVLL